MTVKELRRRKTRVMKCRVLGLKLSGVSWRVIRLGSGSNPPDFQPRFTLPVEAGSKRAVEGVCKQ